MKQTIMWITVKPIGNFQSKFLKIYLLRMTVTTLDKTHPRTIKEVLKKDGSIIKKLKLFFFNKRAF